MVTSIDNPFMFGCLALDIAGFKVGEMDIDIMASSPDEGFRLVFDINERLTLSVGFDKEAGSYSIAGAIPDPAKQPALLELALKLNFVLLEQGRSFSIDPGSEKLVLTQLIDIQRLELEILAEAIADITQTVLALDGYEFDAKQTTRDTEPVDWNTVVRG